MMDKLLTAYQPASVAQGTEQRFPKPRVAGSSPAGGAWYHPEPQAALPSPADEPSAGLFLWPAWGLPERQTIRRVCQCAGQRVAQLRTLRRCGSQ